MKKKRRFNRTDRLVSWIHSPGQDFIWKDRRERREELKQESRFVRHNYTKILMTPSERLDYN